MLARLPEAELSGLTSHLHHVSLAPKEVVQRARERVEQVYFPTCGVFSITTALPDGVSVEAATIGDEGMLGIEAFLSDDPRAAGDTLLQVPDGAALRLSVGRFRQEMAERRALFRLVGNYIQMVLGQFVQAAACNARHPAQDRCAKWLLLTHDRMHTDHFRLSHDVLAMMLGTTRPTATVAAQALQHAGLIAYTYGHVQIRNRAGLESAACSCYAAIREQFKSLLR